MNIKELVEKQNDLKDEMVTIVNKAKNETRELTDEEKTRFDACKKEIAGIEDTITRMEEISTMERKPIEDKTPAMTERMQFENAIRGYSNAAITKADGQITIPTTIGQEILKKVEDVCPIYAMSQHYNITGKLVLVKESDSSTLAMSYVTEGTPASSTGVAFEENIELDGYLASVLTQISNSLIKNSKFDIVDYVTTRIAEAVAEFLEHELLLGSTKAEGLAQGVTQKVTTAKATAITADELIDLQDSIKDKFQSGAVWIMNSKTRSAIRKLKDGQGNYLLNPDLTSTWGYTLLGKPVYTSDQMPAIAAKAKAIYYGDLSGLAVKVSEEFELQILREKYAEQHQTGMVGFTEFDSGVQNTQKLSVLEMAAA